MTPDPKESAYELTKACYLAEKQLELYLQDLIIRASKMEAETLIKKVKDDSIR